MSDKDDDNLERLAKMIGEQFEAKFDAYTEHSDEQNTILQNNLNALIDRKLKPVISDLTEMKGDIKVIKAVLTATNQDLQKHERRLKKLEAAV